VIPGVARHTDGFFLFLKRPRNIRVHDLKRTFGCRLPAAGVSFGDRQDLLGHRSGRITTHYSQAELARLIEAAEKVSERPNVPNHAAGNSTTRQNVSRSAVASKNAFAGLDLRI
jgi:hypothetical protein